MPKLLHARPPLDDAEERRLRKLAASRRAPAEQVVRARTVVQSWDGESTVAIATRLGCHQQTVRDRIARFNANGFRSIVGRSSGGRKPRLTEQQRRAVVDLVQRSGEGELPPHAPDPPQPGPTRNGAGSQAAPWTLDALVAAARLRGIEVRRSQIRRILLDAGIQWHPDRAWHPGQTAE